MAHSKGAQEGPFASSARELASYGLAVIPCGQAEGKKPSVNWPKRRLSQDSRAISTWIERFGGANVGILTGLSGVTIVDIDDPELVPAMLERFGATPLQTRTPSGGTHLWYRHSGERCANLRPAEGLKVDIKAAGGFIVVPPSVRPSGPHAGKSYEFIVGDWRQLPNLPRLKAGSLMQVKREQPKGTPDVPLPAALPCVGERNNTLYMRLKNEIAPMCDSYESLLAAAREINGGFSVPLPGEEVASVARSVWQYKVTGRLFLPSGPATVLLKSDEFGALCENSDALALALVLRFAFPNGAPRGSFRISTKAMERERTIPGWGWRRYKAAAAWLVECGWLEIAREGSTGKAGCTYDAWLYRFSPSFARKGTFSVPNITIHPLPSPPPSPAEAPETPSTDAQASPSSAR